MMNYGIIGKLALNAEKLEIKILNLEADSRSQESIISTGSLENKRQYDSMVRKDAEIARLKGELLDSKEHFNKISGYCMGALDPSFEDRHPVDQVYKLREITTAIVKDQESTIKEREAEANSYKELYNELKEAIYKGVAKPFSQHKTRAEVLYELKQIIADSKRYREEALHFNKASVENNLKYERLTALLARERSKGSCDATALIDIHRENEKKLAAKRKGKVTV